MQDKNKRKRRYRAPMCIQHVLCQYVRVRIRTCSLGTSYFHRKEAYSVGCTHSHPVITYRTDPTATRCGIKKNANMLPTIRLLQDPRLSFSPVQ